MYSHVWLELSLRVVGRFSRFQHLGCHLCYGDIFTGAKTQKQMNEDIFAFIKK